MRKRADLVRRVQVGCGPKNIRAEWLNTDLRDFPGIDQVLDVTQPWPWRDQLDAVYGEHFLEHLTIEQASAFLRYAGEALRKGGLLRLSTPALEFVIETHYPLPPTEGEADHAATLRTNRAFYGWGHHFLYSRNFLSWTLVSHGYEEIEFCEYGESRHEILQGMEMHGGYRRTPMGFPTVWIVEARRGEQPIEPMDVWTERIDTEFSKHVRSGH